MNSQAKRPSERLVRNVASNWAYMALNAVIAFFLSPFLVHTLGTDRYGIWAVAFSILGYLNLLDLGMKQSLARFLSKHYATGSWQSLNEVVSTSTAIYGLAGGLVILATLVVAYFFLGAFKVAPELMSVMRATLIVMGINQAITFFLMTGTAIGAFHRFDISNAIDMIFRIINAAATVVVLKLGYGLVMLAWALLIVNIPRLIVRRLVQQRLVPEIRLRPRFVKKERMRELINYGFISFFIVVSPMVVFYIQNIVIGVFLTTAAVTYYCIAGQVIIHLRGIVSAVGVPLVPAVSHLDATKEHHSVAELHLRITGYLYYLTTTVCIGILFFGKQFIFLWMGPDFGVTVRILSIMTVPACLYLPQMAANSVLLGMSKHKALFPVLLAETIASVALSIALVRAMGLVGVAWGMAIPQLVIYSLVYPRVLQKSIGDDLWKFYIVGGKMIAMAAVCTLPPTLGVMWLNQIDGWPGFFLNVVVVGGVAAAGFWFRILDPITRDRLMGSLRGHGLRAARE